MNITNITSSWTDQFPLGILRDLTILDRINKDNAPLFFLPPLYLLLVLNTFIYARCRIYKNIVDTLLFVLCCLLLALGCFIQYVLVPCLIISIALFFVYVDEMTQPRIFPCSSWRYNCS